MAVNVPWYTENMTALHILLLIIYQCNACVATEINILGIISFSISSDSKWYYNPRKYGFPHSFF